MKGIIQAFKGRSTRVAMMCMALMMAMATSAFAATGDVTVDTSAVTSTFSSITATILIVIGAVAGSAVTIMGVLLAWKYGRKLFGMLAK
ncbi:hypothetical protein NST41_33915 [Paenibacillus sp. FSL L8-0696]|uniref:hypothetical protein n=1 Tax=Paenibacillus sp. FSL L8-0696 TaxID=2954524 RepID=UPI00311A56C6